MTAPKPSEPLWRVGRKLGRTLYVHDQVVGMVDTPELAAAIVDAMNGEIAKADAAGYERGIRHAADELVVAAKAAYKVGAASPIRTC